MAVAAAMAVVADATVTEAFPRSQIAPGEAHAGGLSVKNPGSFGLLDPGIPNGLSVLTGMRKTTCACWLPPPEKHDLRQAGRKIGGQSSLLVSGRELCPPICWLWCTRLSKKAAGLASGGMIKSPVNRGRGQTAIKNQRPVSLKSISKSLRLIWASPSPSSTGFSNTLAQRAVSPSSRFWPSRSFSRWQSMQLLV